jgi:hypothetical protein
VTESDTPVPPTRDPKTPLPKRKVSQKPAPPSPAVAYDTEPEAPPPKVKSRSLRRLDSYIDLEEVDPGLRKPPPANKRPASSGHREDVGKSKKARAEGELVDEAIVNPGAWRTWKSRSDQTTISVAGDIDTREKAKKEGAKPKAKAKVKSARTDQIDHGMIEIDSEESADENVTGGERNKMKEKGKGKMKADEGPFGEMKMWVVPTLPSKTFKGRTESGSAKRIHQNLEATDPK